MPELPEVEITRRQLAPHLAGATIESVRTGKPLRWPLGCAPRHLCGKVIVSVGRRAKYLIFHLDEGVLIVHLGMSGSLSLQRHPPPAGPHDHFEMQTTAGTLRLNDPRRFGAVISCSSTTSPAAQKLLGRLGVEPLGDQFDVRDFHSRLRKHRASIKQVLLGGRIVAGVGNIYASEALFCSGIHPATPAARISLQRAARLHAAICEVLQQAIAAGGSTLRDFSSPDGQEGHFQNAALVYDRAGQPCPACARPLRFLRQNGRSTFFCPACQHY